MDRVTISEESQEIQGILNQRRLSPKLGSEVAESWALFSKGPTRCLPGKWLRRCWSRF